MNRRDNEAIAAVVEADADLQVRGERLAKLSAADFDRLVGEIGPDSILDLETAPQVDKFLDAVEGREN